jgi:hypothetical protein
MCLNNNLHVRCFRVALLCQQECAICAMMPLLSVPSDVQADDDLSNWNLVSLSAQMHTSVPLMQPRLP